jgi:hypothetical protein
LPRHIYRAILRVLRPAESAVRRLIIIAARGLVVNFRDSLHNSSGPLKNKAQLWQELSKLSPKFCQRTPTFCLIDPLKRFTPSLVLAGDDAYFFADDPQDADHEAFANDIKVQRAFPRISVPGLFDPVFHAPKLTPTREDPVNAAHLFLRLAALRHALNTLPKQARRLARWQALRNASRLNRTKPMRMSPFRPGRPPGHRTRQTHGVDHILKECHSLARDVQAEANTS